MKLYWIPGSQLFSSPLPFMKLSCASFNCLILLLLPSPHLPPQLEYSLPFQGWALGGGVATLRANP